MSTTLLDVEAVRARYSALDRRLAFFDGPGGTQCPDEVIDAIARYLREDNANIGAPYDTSLHTVELVERAHAAAGRFLSCHPDEVAFGQSMTSLNFLLTRALGRTLERGRRDRLHPARPRRERRSLARARGGSRRRRPLRRRARRPVARPRRPGGAALGPHEGRRLPDRLERGRDDARRRPRRRARARRRRARLGRRRPLRAARPDRRRRLGRRRAPLLAVQVLRPAHGDGVRQARAARERAPVQGAPGAERARRTPLRARHAAARAPRGLRRRGRVHRVARLGGDRGARAAARRALPRRAPAGGGALRAADDGGPRADVRLQSRRAAPPRRSRSSSPRARSRSGTATTTRSRS